jgi:hypothetical protein
MFQSKVSACKPSQFLQNVLPAVLGFLLCL